MKNIAFLLTILFFINSACQQTKKIDTAHSDSIRLNQVGYYPMAVKQFVVADTETAEFDVINDQGKSVFSGNFTDNGTWDKSGEHILMGDFSTLNQPGTYRVLLDNGTASYPFRISEGIYEEALHASIKSFYYQRASMAIEEAYGGKWKREAGHPDDKCLFHPSTGKTGGTLNSPGGWYDAGDYGKYIVNAAISVGQMLNLIEQYPGIIPDGSLNIPESGNGITDLWDELRYELDWMGTMQDTDGGVFHKLTAKKFGGFIMPAEYGLGRYIIGKGTAATLDFAAVMAQASRLYKTIDADRAKKALAASEKAWNWALENDNVLFRNPKDVSTGQYGGVNVSDDFYWAAAELYITTGKQGYLQQLSKHKQEYRHQLTNSWKYFIRNMGFHSLLENRKKIDQDLAAALEKAHLKLADEMVAQMERNPYRIALEHYEWGSNSDILNQAMILCYAHRLSGDKKYLEAVEKNTDYIFGKNATGYCFLTGYGSKQVMHIHHRPSGADGIEAPVPGFISGGPNPARQDKAYVTYNSELPAKAFMDEQGSYASNEVCLNWNAPAVFVLGYLEQANLKP